MRTETITRNLFTFDELSEEAQDKALDSLRDINLHFDWWDGVYYDADNIGLKITGFDLDRNRHATGNFVNSAAYTADRILTEHGNQCDTYELADKFKTEHDRLSDLSDELSKTDKWDNMAKVDGELTDLENEFLADLLECYASMLQREYEYLYSDEAIKETIMANSYEFTEDGERA
jgi:hypothetical protein